MEDLININFLLPVDAFFGGEVDDDVVVFVLEESFYDGLL